MARPAQQTLVIFAKAPQQGAVKTRLASSVGDRAAQEIYVRLSRRILSGLSAVPRWQTVVAGTPPNLSRHRLFRQPSAAFVDQGTGDLGERMARSLLMGSGATIVVGTDIPKLDAARVSEAFHLLSSHDAIFGPAVDGGYWLVGLRKKSLAPIMFKHVRWSTEHALADTLKNIKSARVGLLPTLRDLDDAADLRLSDLV